MHASASGICFNRRTTEWCGFWKDKQTGGITGHGGRPSSIATLDIYTSCLKRVGMVHGTFLPPAFPCEWKDNDQRRREWCSMAHSVLRLNEHSRPPPCKHAIWWLHDATNNLAVMWPQALYRLICSPLPFYISTVASEESVRYVSRDTIIYYDKQDNTCSRARNAMG